MKSISALSRIGLALLCALMAACDKKPQQGSSQQQQQSQQSAPSAKQLSSPATPAKPVIKGIGGEVPAEKAPSGAVADSSPNFLFVFDGSGSMDTALSSAEQRELSGQKVQGKAVDNRVRGAKWAIQQSMPNIPANANLGLIVFDGRGLRLVIPLGKNNREEFIKAVMAVEPGGGTPLKEALILAGKTLLEQYPKQLGYGDYRIICVTDGEADGGANACRDAGNFLSDNHVPLYTIGFQLGGTHGLQPYSVGKEVKSAASSRELVQVLNEALAEVDTDAPAQSKGR